MKKSYTVVGRLGIDTNVVKNGEPGGDLISRKPTGLHHILVPNPHS